MSTFMLGRRDFLKAAAAGGFVLTPVAQAVSAAIDNLACLLQVLRQTNRIRQPKVAGNRLESVRYLQAG